MPVMAFFVSHIDSNFRLLRHGLSRNAYVYGYDIAIVLKQIVGFGLEDSERISVRSAAYLSPCLV